jgi:hypothetical protein
MQDFSMGFVKKELNLNESQLIHLLKNNLKIKFNSLLVQKNDLGIWQSSEPEEVT